MAEINKSRRSPSLSTFSLLGNSSASTGISLPLSLATFFRTSVASDTRPFFNNHRTDSGVILEKEKAYLRASAYLPFLWHEVTTLCFLLSPSIKFAGTDLYTWVGRAEGTVRA